MKEHKPKLVYIVYYTERSNFEGMFCGVFSTKNKALKFIRDTWYENKEDMESAQFKPNKWELRKCSEVCILESELNAVK